ncbi:MAG TPA: hypothetical protein VI911_11335 [Patescibacteria group bacterium]|nr:hypothetical protein [Patescibacteria group bacterium]
MCEVKYYAFINSQKKKCQRCGELYQGEDENICDSCVNEILREMEEYENEFYYRNMGRDQEY